MVAKAFVLQKATTVYQLLDTWPQTSPFFLKNQMGCIGCSMASFCTLGESAAYYEIDVRELLQELSHMIKA